MGSIVSILTRSAPIRTGLAQQMLAAAPHRGSDYVVTEFGNCILGVSNRADFVDSTLSNRDHLMAVFSGKLDNAAELHKMLCERGHRPASTEPAEITVSAFEAFGSEAPNRMRGTFAAIVTDGRQLWCFRDHLGLKSLFYRDDPKGFFVATEAKQIIAGAALRREPNIEALEDIFYGRRKEEKTCALQGVDRLPQATTLAVTIDKPSASRRYWRPAELLETVRLSPADVGEKFSQLFAQAVGRSLTGEDVISLSGGIDSPAVAAFAAPQYLKLKGRPLPALSAVFPDLPAVDESAYIKLIVEYLGMDLHTYRIQAGILDDVQHWCNLLDGPIPTVAIPEIHENYALARQFGYRNILTGELAEFVIFFHFHVLAHLLTEGRWKALWSLIATELRRGKSRRALLEQLILSLTPGWYLRLRSRDLPKPIPDWLDRCDERNRRDLAPPARKRWSAQQLAALKGSTIMMDADELCAAVSGVTVRRPFVDIDLWEFFLSMPAEVKFPDLRSKTLVRTLLRGKLPDAILDRRDKTVFNDHMMAQVDYRILRRFLVSPNHEVKGVDYRRLAAHIEREDFTLVDWVWANTLVRVHAFLSLW